MAQTKTPAKKAKKTARLVDVAPARVPEYDEEKLKELIVYISEKSEDDPSFGDTKLNKILFFSDFLSYGAHGRPITGAVYQKLPYGPAPRRLLPARDALKKEKAVETVQKGRALKRTVTVNRRAANTRLFSQDELDVVDEVIELLRDMNGYAVSELSHRLSAGWNLAEIKEDIPYDSIFLSVGEELTPYEIERGQKLAAELGLTA